MYRGHYRSLVRVPRKKLSFVLLRNQVKPCTHSKLLRPLTVLMKSFRQLTHMNYKTYESMTRAITALVVYEYHYALNYMVYGKSNQYIDPLQ